MKKTNKIKKLLLKLGASVVSLGALVGILAIPSKAESIYATTILDISNLHQATFYYYTLNENNDWVRCYETIVKDGVFGYENNIGTWEINLSNFTTTSEYQTYCKNNIYSPYGLFYGTEKSIYSFINEEGTYPYIEEQAQSFLEYEFITPLNLYNVDFKNKLFDNIEFLDSEGNTIYSSREGTFTCSVPNCLKIRGIKNTSDYYDESVYLISAPGLNGYNRGYTEGYNSRNQEIDTLKSENNTLKNINENLQAEVTSLNAQLQNVNGSWQGVFYTMVDIPFLTMSKVLGFEIFGLNLYRALIGIITTLAVFFLLRKIMGH